MFFQCDGCVNFHTMGKYLENNGNVKGLSEVGKTFK